jgi:predicted TIM-barrel fold metal-dependent hydrolase
MTSEHTVDRRTFLKGSGLMALSAAGVLHSGDAAAQVVVPNSAGSDLPKLKAPANACDCHHHIYDTRFPFSQPGARMVPDSRVSDYRLLQRRIGTTRSIVVTPAPYPASAADNQVTLDAIAQFGTNARGVAIVSPAITDAELKSLHEGGIRGIRFSLAALATVPPSVLDAIAPLSKRVAALGWHVQINMTADQIVGAGGVWDRMASPIVFDHMGHMPQPTGTAHPAFTTIRRLVDKGRTWVKLSITYDSSRIGPPTYADVTKVGQAYVEAAPERMVWGSNWPHPNEPDKPNDALLFDQLAQWAPREATRRRILVENPETLYGFAKST